MTANSAKHAEAAGQTLLVEGRGSMPDEMSHGLTLDGIAKSYGGVAALRGASLHARFGEVHGLVGENGAGKSTLVKILSGAVTSDAGTIRMRGRELEIDSPGTARKAGIGTVFQELSSIPDLSVAANLVWGSADDTFRRRAFGGRRRAAAKLLRQIGLGHVDPDMTVRDLRLSERQMLEIGKVLLRKPDVLLLDESTAALLPDQVDWLFARVAEFVKEGGAAIFISHRLDEVRRICDRLTVFRGGEVVKTGATHDLSESELVEAMLGRKLERIYPERPSTVEKVDPPLLQVEELSATPTLKDVSVSLAGGEILGVGGLQGQGQAELFLSLFGARSWDGAINLDGESVHPRRPRQALEAGIVLIPEDRASDGLCLSLTARENISLGNFQELTRFGFVSRSREGSLFARYAERLAIPPRSRATEVRTLSGGNQQKVLIARALAHRPRVVLFYDGARGVDVGTKSEIFQLLRDLCGEGAGVLFYSSDVAELANVADRVIVLHDGRIRAELAGDDLSEKRIVAAAVGGGSHG